MERTARAVRLLLLNVTIRCMAGCAPLFKDRVAIESLSKVDGAFVECVLVRHYDSTHSNDRQDKLMESAIVIALHDTGVCAKRWHIFGYHDKGARIDSIMAVSRNLS